MKKQTITLDINTLRFVAKLAWAQEFTCKPTKEGRTLAHAYSTMQKIVEHYIQRQEKNPTATVEIDALNESSANVPLKEIWMRLGVTLHLTDDEVNAILSWGDESGNAVKNVIAAGRFDVNGDSYIPADCVEDFDDENGTSFHTGDDIGFEL